MVCNRKHKFGIWERIWERISACHVFAGLFQALIESLIISLYPANEKLRLLRYLKLLIVR